jgi:hypothetical protein
VDRLPRVFGSPFLDGLGVVEYQIPVFAWHPRKLSARLWLRIGLGSVGFWLGACGGGTDDPATPADQPPACLPEPADGSCQSALYGVEPVTGEIQPTFSDVFAGTLEQKCATTTACHRGTEAQRGLALDDPDTAYDLLLGESSSGHPIVVPGDLACGELLVRLESGSTRFSMPPGRLLGEPELCAIRHWIAQGASR